MAKLYKINKNSDNAHKHIKKKKCLQYYYDHREVENEIRRQYEFFRSFDSAKMLQISKFSAFLDPSSSFDFSASI
jgi:hypothetical protein